LPTLLDVERAISELQHARRSLTYDAPVPPDRWALERAQSLERVLAWLELELGPLVAELGVPIAAQASLTEVPPVEGIRRVLLERVGLGERRDFTPSDLGELGGTVAPPACELAERLHELGEVTPEEGRSISGGECSGELSCTCVACFAADRLVTK
jgi:hypothetical protein